MVGWGGNNGSTVTASLLANQRGLSWESRAGRQTANMYGSLLFSSTVKLGTSMETGKSVHVPMSSLLPMVDPTSSSSSLVIGGWDINGANLAEAMDRAGVLGKRC